VIMKNILGKLIVLASLALFSYSSWADFIIFPAKGQSDQQMEQDKFFCYDWAKKQSGFDPMKMESTPPAPQAPAKVEKKSGGVVKGAVGGGVFGAIAGDSSKAAKRGAVAGGILGAVKQNRTNSQIEQQAKVLPKPSNQGQKDTYKRAYTACLEGKGYTVK